MEKLKVRRICTVAPLTNHTLFVTFQNKGIEGDSGGGTWTFPFTRCSKRILTQLSSAWVLPGAIQQTL